MPKKKKKKKKIFLATRRTTTFIKTSFILLAINSTPFPVPTPPPYVTAPRTIEVKVQHPSQHHERISSDPRVSDVYKI
jgi:hypothetical protein